jgi:hypothetical protein
MAAPMLKSTAAARNRTRCIFIRQGTDAFEALTHDDTCAAAAPTPDTCVTICHMCQAVGAWRRHQPSGSGLASITGGSFASLGGSISD